MTKSNMIVTKEIINKWIHALRSGEYKQTKNVLASPEGFCCLGVLCEVMQIPKTIDDDGITTYEFGGIGDTAMLRGLTLKTLEDLLGYYAVNLSVMNDKGMNFKEIADKIESSVKDL